MTNIKLPDVTLLMCASIEIDLHIRVLNYCRRHLDFGSVKLLTDVEREDWEDEEIDGIEFAKVPKIETYQDYSDCKINQMPKHVDTEFCFNVHTDGFILNPRAWEDDFLKYDYIGPPWAPFPDIAERTGVADWATGNGGFSIRSKKFLDLCEGLGHSKEFFYDAPDPFGLDDVICAQVNRKSFEEQGAVYAPIDIGFRFGIENGNTRFNMHGMADQGQFGFHGHLPHMCAGLKGEAKAIYREDYVRHKGIEEALKVCGACENC